MGVCVLHLFVLMFMGVPGLGRKTRMLVPMVPVVVAMRMGMSQLGVPVKVTVSARKQNSEGDNDETGRYELNLKNRLSEKSPRDRRSDERRRCKQHLRPRRTELLRTRDVQNDGKSVGGGADRERRGNNLRSQFRIFNEQPQAQVA